MRSTRRTKRRLHILWGRRQLIVARPIRLLALRGRQDLPVQLKAGRPLRPKPELVAPGRQRGFRACLQREGFGVIQHQGVLRELGRQSRKAKGRLGIAKRGRQPGQTDVAGLVVDVLLFPTRLGFLGGRRRRRRQVLVDLDNNRPGLLQRGVQDRACRHGQRSSRAKHQPEPNCARNQAHTGIPPLPVDIMPQKASNSKVEPAVVVDRPTPRPGHSCRVRRGAGPQTCRVGTLTDTWV